MWPSRVPVVGSSRGRRRGPVIAVAHGLALTNVTGGIPGDIDGDGDVDTVDLLLLLGDWGCTGGGCIGDLNGDGITDAADLLILLGNRG
jgi:hypothetical protein